MFPFYFYPSALSDANIASRSSVFSFEVVAVVVPGSAAGVLTGAGATLGAIVG
jgi:hypothetical protein